MMMNQFDRRHYSFGREWRGPGREHLPLRSTVNLRQQEPPASLGDKTVCVGAVVVFLILVLLT